MLLETIELTKEAARALWSPETYLDPGSGSYILQILIAGVMGGLLMLRIYWQKVKGFVRRLFGMHDPDEGA